MSIFEELGASVGKVVDQKNKSYGSSFDICGEFLKLLWPNGCPPDKFGELLAFARMFDKMCRIANDANAFSEDPWQDLAGYSLLGLNRTNILKALGKQQEFLDLVSNETKKSPKEIIEAAAALEAKFKEQSTQESDSGHSKK